MAAQWPKRCLVGGGWRQLRRLPVSIVMSARCPAAALALKTQSRLSRLGAEDNDFAVTAAAGLALWAAARCSTSSPAACASPLHTAIAPPPTVKGTR